MKIKNNNIEITLKDSLINSAKYKGNEIFNTTKTWGKKSPILFPVIGVGKKLIVNNIQYPIVKHGFWNEIDFKIDKLESEFKLSGIINHKSFPFEINVNQDITLGKDRISYSTKLKGPHIGIQFGYHPAFNYDIGNMIIKQRNVDVVYKDMSSGKEKVNIKNISELDWDKVDTYVFKLNEIMLENMKYNIWVKTNLDYIALWTNGDKFICIEPWSNMPAAINPNDDMILDGTPLKMDIIVEENT